MANVVGVVGNGLLCFSSLLVATLDGAARSERLGAGDDCVPWRSVFMRPPCAFTLLLSEVWGFGLRFFLLVCWSSTFIIFHISRDCGFSSRRGSFVVCWDLDLKYFRFCGTRRMSYS